jgi:sterol carrier protein 2
MTVNDVFAGMEKRVTGSSIEGVFKFTVTGDDGGDWLVDCTGGTVHKSAGDGDVTITVADEDLVAIVGGSLDPMNAFFMGKIQVEGDMGLAMKLQQLLG